MTRVGLVTCRDLPEPDPDEPLLVAALAARGVDARVVAWDDPAVDWAAFDACVLRSTWNYHRRPAAFLAWLDRVERSTRLWNPPDVVRWNAHKGYLLQVAAAGLPVVPTVLLRAGARDRLADVLEREGWTDVVVKPAISAGSYATIRVRPGDLARGEAHLATLLAAEDALVQPHLASVAREGECSLVVIDGALVHAVRKHQRLAGGHERVDTDVAGFLRRAGSDPDELCARLLARFAPGALYARVDVARDDDGRLRLMELEVIEPSLFFGLGERGRAALDRFAGAIVQRSPKTAV